MQARELLLLHCVWIQHCILSIPALSGRIHL